MKHFLNSLPYPALFLAALLLGLSPFFPEPHLVEKLRLLGNGQLSRPLDIFDLVFHAAPLILLICKGLADLRARLS